MPYLYEALSKPTMLYIKKCSHCNLKYFGKTSKKNVEYYKGSGKRWNKHLHKHNAISLHLWNSNWYYDTQIMRFALKFSRLNKIVASDIWANLIEEDGLCGGDTSKTLGFINSLKRKKTHKGLTYEEIYGQESAQKLKLIRSEKNRERWKSTEFRNKVSSKISKTRKEKFSTGELTIHNKGKKYINFEFEAKKSKIREDFSSSNMTRKEYAKEHSINYRTLNKYLSEK